MMNTNITNAMETTANAVLSTAAVTEPVKASEPTKAAEPAKADKPKKASKPTTKAKASKADKAKKETATSKRDLSFDVPRLDLTEALKLKGKEVKGGKKFVPLKSKEFVFPGGDLWDVYKMDVDFYHDALYDYASTGKTTVKTLDARLKKVMDDLGIAKDDCDKIIRSMGKHIVLVPKVYRQSMTADGRLKKQDINARMAAVWADETLSATARTEKLTTLEKEMTELIDEGLYESTMYKSMSKGTFRKQLEEFIAHRLIDLEITEAFKPLNRSTDTRAWNQSIVQAKKLGITQKTIEKYKNAFDLAGLRADIKQTRETKNAKVIAKAEPKK